MRKFCVKMHPHRSGAEEACWAHNPEVDGSKPSFDTFFCLTRLFLFFAIFPRAHARARPRQTTNDNTARPRSPRDAPYSLATSAPRAPNSQSLSGLATTRSTTTTCGCCAPPAPPSRVGAPRPRRSPLAPRPRRPSSPSSQGASDARPPTHHPFFFLIAHRPTRSPTPHKAAVHSTCSTPSQHRRTTLHGTSKKAQSRSQVFLGLCGPRSVAPLMFGPPSPPCAPAARGRGYARARARQIPGGPQALGGAPPGARSVSSH